ncbi:replication initiator protein [Capybara microvirus Cap1_SP_64]|nr:replication initiator protein [Capybara microvirus Cap1_SP_64]
MKCLHPVGVYINKNYKDLGFFQVPCGKCYNCKQNKAKSVAFRLELETQKASNSFFVTLTYPDHSINKINGVSCVDNFITHRIFKRLRSQVWNEIKKSLHKLPCNRFSPPSVKQRNRQISALRRHKYSLDPIVRSKYFLISEYGPLTSRPHYHFIWFFYDQVDVMEVEKKLLDLWDGIITVDLVNDARINYVSQYCNKDCEPQLFGQSKNITRCSINIGASLENSENYNRILSQQCPRVSWRKGSIKLPSYYIRRAQKHGKLQIKDSYELYTESKKQQQEIDHKIKMYCRKYKILNKHEFLKFKISYIYANEKNKRNKRANI